MNSSETTGKSFLESGWVRLFLISFAVLFFEVLLIRWIASEIRIFGFFKNLILIGAIVGMGIGCSLGGRRAAEATESGSNMAARLGLDRAVFPFLIALICAVLAYSTDLKLTDMSFLITLDVFVWDQFVPTASAFVYNVVAILLIFMSVVVIFDMLGQELGAALAGREPLPAYSINLAGSLFGVLVYTLVSYLATPPWVWLAIGFSALLPFYRKPLHIALFLASIVFAFICTGESQWSPYYRIDLKPFYISVEEGKRRIEVGRHLNVNHDYHQKTMDFRKEFLAANPELSKARDFQIYFNTYNFPYEVAPALNRVLVLGAGTGNDVAAALRHGAGRVDAVEIDPSILKLGKAIHPEKPYSDNRVHPHNNDARAYLSNDRDKYDLIVFGHVDSHTTFSTLSSVRLDNFLYTSESIASATSHLSDQGIGALSFAAGPKWLRARLYQVVKANSTTEPIVLHTEFDNPGSITILWGPGLDKARSKIGADKEIIAGAELSGQIEMPTDDWPFLYQEKRNIPPVYLIMLAVVFIVSAVIIFVRMRLSLGALVNYSQFFFLGAGFLLLETRGMLAVSILFGSTWLVNSVVIATVLGMALIANYVVMKVQAIKEWHGYAALALSLVVMYLVPLAPYSGADLVTRLLVSFFVLGLPFAFSGIVFSRSLSKVKETEKALGINILGALLGGCLEYLSTVVGTNGLTLVSMAIYLISFLVSIMVARSISSDSSSKKA
ncbi:MAG: hypothetical protein R3D26_01525 [Cyanobacteriota/Melainabacteria group bacterium]